MSKSLVTSEPICKDSEYKLNKETCLFEKKTKKLKSKLKLVEKLSPSKQSEKISIIDLVNDSQDKDDFLNKTVVNKVKKK